MSYLLNGDRIIMGTDYYPEHWDEQLWGQDLDRMHETGIEVIRVAEFSWNVFEPAEGEYSYDFFDRFLDLCEEKNMKMTLKVSSWRENSSEAQPLWEW